MSVVGIDIRPCVEADLPAVMAYFVQSVQTLASRYYLPRKDVAAVAATEFRLDHERAVQLEQVTLRNLRMVRSLP